MTAENITLYCMIIDESFLQAMCGVESISLNTKFESSNADNDESDQIQIMHHSSYYDKDKFDNLIEAQKQCFSIFSSNMQCIGSKFDELKILIEDIKVNHDFEFSAICLHECQFKETDSITQFELDNYKLISQGKPNNPCSTKGGLIIYLNNKFQVPPKITLNTFTTWEGQVIKINNSVLKKPIILGNICRPPKDNNAKYRQFIEEIAPILSSLENKNSECIIVGDLNINLLKVNEKEIFGEFFDTLTENSFYPKITLPTRFLNKHGTLIDHLFCKLTDKSKNPTSGIPSFFFFFNKIVFTFVIHII